MKQGNYYIPDKRAYVGAVKVAAWNGHVEIIELAVIARNKREAEALFSKWCRSKAFVCKDLYVDLEEDVKYGQSEI